MAKWAEPPVKLPAWKRVSSGKYVDLNNLTSFDIKLSDIETSLNNITRFTGHYKNLPPLTVAQHSFLCLMLAQEEEPENYELQIRTFIHDFAEAYIGDVATPVKKVMGQAWKDFSKPIEKIVEETFLPQPCSIAMREQVKIYDALSLDIERRSMWRDQTGKDKWPKLSVPASTPLADKQELFRSAAEETHIHIEKIYLSLKEEYDLSLQAEQSRK